MTPTLIHRNRANGTFIVEGDPGDFASFDHSTQHAGNLGASWADPVNGGTASSQWEVSPPCATALGFSF